jgi:hypothetical protein
MLEDSRTCGSIELGVATIRGTPHGGISLVQAGAVPIRFFDVLGNRHGQAHLVT